VPKASEKFVLEVADHEVAIYRRGRAVLRSKRQHIKPRVFESTRSKTMHVRSWPTVGVQLRDGLVGNRLKAAAPHPPAGIPRPGQIAAMPAIE
jgi:hypothetical protein